MKLIIIALLFAGISAYIIKERNARKREIKKYIIFLLTFCPLVVSIYTPLKEENLELLLKLLVNLIS